MIVIKIYEHYWSDTIIHQQYITHQVEIKDDLGYFSTATFRLDNYSIDKYNKVEIYEAGTLDILKFKWYVRDVNKRANILNETCEVTCWDGKGLLQERWPLYWYKEVSTPLNIVISNMLSLWNDIGDKRSYDIQYTTPIDIEYQLGSTCYNIIDELANQVGAYWRVRNGQILMADVVGKDKTIGSEQVRLFFDGTTASNVKEVFETQSEDRANVAIGISNEWGKLMLMDLELYPYGVVIENFQSWDLEKKTEALLDKNNVDKRSLWVVLDENRYYGVDVGDKVWLQVEGLKTIKDFSGEAFVLSKTTTYKAGKRYEVVEIGNVPSTSGTLVGLIKGMNDKIDKIRNK